MVVTFEIPIDIVITVLDIWDVGHIVSLSAFSVRSSSTYVTLAYEGYLGLVWYINYLN